VAWPAAHLDALQSAALLVVCSDALQLAAWLVAHLDALRSAALPQVVYSALSQPVAVVAAGLQVLDGSLQSMAAQDDLPELEEYSACSQL
jgi:citrate synthase